MSSGNAVAIRYIEEATYGVTPTTGAFETARAVSESIGGNPETTISNESQEHRMDTDQIQVGLSVAGGINGELSATTWDAFMEAAMCDEWATGTADELNIGTNDKSFSISKAFTDHTTPYYINTTGMRVGTMNAAFAYGSIATIDFGFAGNGITPGTVDGVAGTATVNPATTTEVMNASSNVNNILVNGVAANQCIQQLNISLDNNLNERNCIGSIAPSDHVKYTASVGGSMNMYFGDNSQAIYDAVINNDSFSIQWTATDGTNSLTFFIPNARISGEAPNKGGKDTDVMLNIDFNGLYDPVTQTALRITRA